MRRIVTAALLCGVLATLTACHGNADKFSLDQRLERGINLQLAASAAHQGEPSGAFKMPAEDDLRLIRELGFRHARIRVNPQELMAIGGLNDARVARLQSVIELINEHDLAVILTVQPDSDFKAGLTPGSPATASFSNFWRALAKRLSGISQKMLVFEPLNEPEHESASAWQAVQELLVGAIRAGAPEHSIVVAGHRFSSIPQLLEMQPLPYSNLYYSFHFYDPHNFTHQGANWGWPMWQLFHDWPYPSSPEAVEPLVVEHVPDAREHLLHYGRQQWDKAKLADELDRANAWAQRHGVPLVCTEFGAYRDGIQPQYRRTWLSDVASLLNSRKIGWTLWDYSGNFGLVTGEPGARELDQPAVDALGLK